eukprot:gnl/Dysnectes_brevis/832_a917_2631.p1 GENE.gnl/Dysnectes_brevis/832_a917_2631~~gnl/Dysnectes_brevis/832_a917_2631.p1  ORF type:complete len:221 (-),score=70.12 gnl/Dysnectes_brevis/832_a917_2631:119-781(-)
MKQYPYGSNGLSHQPPNLSLPPSSSLPSSGSLAHASILSMAGGMSKPVGNLGIPPPGLPPSLAHIPTHMAHAHNTGTYDPSTAHAWSTHSLVAPPISMAPTMVGTTMPAHVQTTMVPGGMMPGAIGSMSWHSDPLAPPHKKVGGTQYMASAPSSCPPTRQPSPEPEAYTVRGLAVLPVPEDLVPEVVEFAFDMHQALLNGMNLQDVIREKYKDMAEYLPS